MFSTFLTFQIPLSLEPQYLCHLGQKQSQEVPQYPHGQNLLQLEPHLQQREKLHHYQ